MLSLVGGVSPTTHIAQQVDRRQVTQRMLSQKNAETETCRVRKSRFRADIIQFSGPATSLISLFLGRGGEDLSGRWKGEAEEGKEKEE